MARSLVDNVEETSVKRKTALGRRRPKLDNARRLKGIYYIDPEHMEFNETMKNARNKLEMHMDPAMLCKLRKTSGSPRLSVI